MWVRDAVYRVVLTFLEAALGVLSFAALTDTASLKNAVAVAGVAGLAAAIAAAKTIVAKQLNGTASLVTPS